jgi:DNA-binding NarL/FixJ family response regulator
VTIKVLVVEDEPLLRQRFCDAVRAEPALSLCGWAGTWGETCALLDSFAPDVVLADLGLADGRGVAVIRRALAGDAARDVIVVTLSGEDGDVIDSIRAGATGYLLKDSSPGDIAAAILQVHAGGSPISPAIARRVLECFRVLDQAAPGAALRVVAGDQHPSLLSAREQEILRLVAKGLSFKDVGTVLAISSHTVITHLKRIYQKLAVHSRAEAVYEAGQMGLL